MRFDQVAILDWSAAKGPKTGKDSIWLGIADAAGTVEENLPTRAIASARLAALMRAALANKRRLLIGADFSFGFPSGFSTRITGVASALSMWNWLSDHVTDQPGNISNYRDVAARMNAVFSENGPFWGNTARLDVVGLPRLKPPLPSGLSALRQCDMVARESGSAPKAVWQLAGAGAVGAQVLTGLPALNGLRRDFGDSVSVWPFECADSPIVFAEVYPSLLQTHVRAALVTAASEKAVMDQIQVRLLARALARHADAGTLSTLMKQAVSGPSLMEEGWILGAGQSAFLASGLV